MAAKALPCPTLLRLLLDYNPETGKLYWKSRKPWMGRAEDGGSRFTGKSAGKEAFTARTNGYLRGNLLGRPVRAHRAAFAHHHGVWPDYVDHINGDRTDNRAKNLRSATKSENARNKSSHRNASSKFLGVSFYKATGAWTAQATVQGRKKHIGYFSDPVQAARAYDEFAKEHYGEFARLNFP